MRAVVIPEPGIVSVEEVPDPVPAPSQVVVAVDRCGICGTDRHLLAGDNPFARWPVIPGHEFAGRVVALGSEVVRLQLDQLVAVDPSYFCGRCEQCRAGWPNLCPFKGGYGSGKPGGLAEYVAVEDASCALLPDGVGTTLGALAEPLACVLHGMDNLGPVLGDRVLLYGAGPIGLMACALLARAGSESVTLVERDEARRAAGRAFGATEVVSSADAVDGRDGYHVVVDATGNPAAMMDGFSRIRSGGRFLILGVASRDARIELSPFEINWRELRIIGSMAIRHTFGRAVRLLEAGAFDAPALVTGELPLDGFVDAIATLGSAGHLKVHITPGAGGREPSMSP